MLSEIDLAVAAWMKQDIEDNILSRKLTARAMGINVSTLYRILNGQMEIKMKVFIDYCDYRHIDAAEALREILETLEE